MLADPMSPDATTHEVNVIPMNFRTDYKEVPGKPGEFTEVHKVDLVKKGSNGECTPWTIKALRKQEMLWPNIQPYYDRWVEGQEDPEDGTPIDCLPFIPATLVPHLRLLHLRSAEDLASCTDADLERIGMGARMWREKARAYLDNKPAAEILAANAELNEKLESQQNEIDELKEQINSLVGAAGAPKPGRPKKAA